MVIDLKERRETRCPNCGSENRIPIFWGPTSDEAIESHKRGEIFLSSCEPRDHTWHCRDCESSWGPRTLARQRGKRGQYR
jgi:hypothetical protein